MVRRHGAEVVVRYKERGATKQGTFELPSPLLRVPGETQSGFTPAPPPPPPSRTEWTRLVPPPVLTGHVSSLLPY